MRTFSFALEKEVPPGARADVDDRLGYLDESVKKVQLLPDGVTVRFEADDMADPAAIEARTRKLIAAMLQGFREPKQKEAWRHDHAFAARDTWSELVARDLLQEVGPGLVYLKRDAARVLEGLRQLVHRYAQSLSAEPQQFSTLISIAALDRCHYFSSFPHHVTFAPHVRENLDAIDQVAQSTGGFDGALASPTHVLSPAVCFHAYSALSDRQLAAPLTLTATGRCCRYEAKALSRLERSWEFTMQEIIFIGPADWVQAQREATLEFVKGLVERWGLSAHLELANDPFFVTDYAAKRFHQLSSSAKYELRLHLTPERSLAATSFNLHGDFFGKSYGIDHAGMPVHTGCTAFGLERWVWALFVQLGSEVSAWPTAVRAEVGL